MPEKKEKDYDDLYKRYTKKLSEQLDKQGKEEEPITSREYVQFKKEYMPKPMTLYEKACNFSEKTFKIKTDKVKEKNMQEFIDVAHLNITPEGAMSFSFLFPLLLIFVGTVISITIPMLLGSKTNMFFIMFFVLTGLIMIFPLQKMPEFMANTWRLKASNQMVMGVFYIVTYMRHTSNLELAINFAAEHLGPPLSLDFKKVLWDVENGKYESMKESLDHYLETWRKWNMEFIESIHLIESSLYENSEERRVESLDKALNVILDETYEKMLHYAHNLKSPITMLHMIGIILPILGMVILPLLINFVDGVSWYHIAALYNVALPILVYYMGKVILSTRPTGYGEVDISEQNPELNKYKKILIKISGFELRIEPMIIALFIGIVLFIIGISPIIIHKINPSFDLSIGSFDLLGYRCPQEKTIKCDTSADSTAIGPFGLGASILSLAVVLSFGIGIGLYYKLKTENVIKIREQSKKLEEEIASSIFQLGNRIGDGIPAEIAFGKVAEQIEGTYSGGFFQTVSNNITKMGMNVEQAIFDPKYGALVYYPSNLIESTMKVLVESAKKGPQVAAQSLVNVSRYIKEIHKVDERLKDLMADIISSMKSQISFLTPAIAGIVVGITSMITTVLGNLSGQAQSIVGQAQGSDVSSFIMLFGEGIPTFYFQLIVGIYVVQIVFILTIIVNSIENGADKLNERYLLGTNLTKSTILYCAISLIIIIIFNMVASMVMTSITV
jgi:hypothetical protein